MTDADDGGSYDKADGCKDDDEVDIIDDGGDGGVDENYDCGNADGYCDGADGVEDGIEDDEDNDDDGVILMLATYTYVRMSVTVWSRWWRRCG